MKSILNLGLLVAAFILSGCASTIQLSSLSKPTSPTDTVTVSAFSYAKGAIGLDAGTYTIEYENQDGFYYRGQGLPVQIPLPLNMNKEKYPEGKFPGGLFVPRSGDTKGYRVYYYQLNLPGSPGPDAVTSTAIARTTVPSAGPVAAGVGAGIGAGIVGYMIESGRGQIVLIAATDEINISSYASKP